MTSIFGPLRGSTSEAVPRHEHEAADIMGEASFITVRADKVLAGTITGKEIIIAGGTSGILRSDNFSTGVSGWQILGDGVAEFQDITIRGVVTATAGSDVDWTYISNVSIVNADIISLTFDKITAATNTASLVIGGAGTIGSSNFSTGVSGWQITGAGVAEFQSVTVRGAVTAETGSGLPATYFTAGTIGAEEIILSNSASAILRSSNFVAGSAGWRIRGNGDAEFNDITVRGDIESGNWDGTSPANLASRDTGATVGFYLDSSVGSAQLEGNLFIGTDGVIEWEGGAGLLRTNATGSQRIEVDQNSISFVNSSNVVLGGMAFGGADVSFSATYGAVGTPTYNFQGDDDTGAFRYAANIWGLAAGGALTARGTSTGAVFFGSSATGKGVIQNNAGAVGNPTYSFEGNANLGMYRSGTNSLYFATIGVARFGISGATVQSPAIKDNTTGSAASVFISSTGSGDMQRSTSARKYKSRITDAPYLADIVLTPSKFYRKDDKRWWYGFIADDLGDQDELLGDYADGEIENYDQRAVMAVLAAKVNRLEKRVTDLLEAA